MLITICDVRLNLIVVDFRKRQAHRKVPTILLQDLVTDEGRDRPPHVILLDQLFTFIGSNPEKAVIIYLVAAVKI